MIMAGRDSDPFTSFVHSVLGFPSAVYNRGGERGREWSQTYRGDDANPEQRRERQCARRRTSNAQSGDGNGDDSDDWMYKVARDIEKNEARAQSLYNSWKQEEEMEQSQREKEARRHRHHESRRSRWWGNKCHQNESGSENAARSMPAVPPTAEHSDSPRSLESQWEEFEKDASELLQGADKWRKEWFGDKMWPSADLFGSDTPFSGPLSSLFALGMAPAFLRFEPESNPVGYVLYSSYSPLALEENPGFDRSWRNRYEDLLRAEKGMELMRPEELEGSTTSSGMFWVTKRVMPLLWKSDEPKSVEKGSRREQARIAADDASTEQDMYEGYHESFGDMPRAPVEHPVDMRRFHAEEQLPKPDVLSTLTTTEQNTAPDGTITTKTVLKRRFSNGHEETETKMEVSIGKGTLASAASAAMRHWQQKEEQRPQSQQQFQPLAKAQDRQKPPKGGWFWSSGSSPK